MEQSERITRRFEQVSLQILGNARNELYLNMRYLDLALSALAFQVTTDLPGIGTDGRALYVHPKILADLFERNRILINRAYLHCVMHCLLRHLFKRPGRDALLWRISCDIAVESIIDSMRVRSVRMAVSRPRRNWYELLGKELKVLTSEGVYRVLSRRGLTPFERTALKEAFCIDDHSLWPSLEEDGQPPMPQMEMLQDKWQDISDKTKTEMETFSKEASEGAGDLASQMQVEMRKRYDYRGFLRKFASLKEEMQMDPDTFDYVFYTYGLSLYGNMPLIEPQEYREVRRIEEFVIVIDVSMSTSGDLVKTFLEQTYSVLTEQDSYLRKVHIRILQCDEQVREDQKITSREELDDYMKQFVLKGGGGTDFRPAFSYVRGLVDGKQFAHLKGMIYFTDGYGIYPRQRPLWDTAFVFMEEDYSDVQVPPWAIKLIIEKETMEEEQKKLKMDYTFLE